MMRLLEVINVTVGTIDTTKAHIVSSFRLCIVATWMKEQGDESKEFEAVVAIEKPDGSVTTLPPDQPYRFRFPDGKELQRLTLNSEGPPPFGATPGIVWIESRIREVGSEEWYARQRYPLFLRIIHEESANEKRDDGEKEREVAVNKINLVEHRDNCCNP